MNRQPKLRSAGTIAAAIIVALFAAVKCSAASGKILHAFYANDGTQPRSELARDAQGNLYGSTLTGGFYNAGMVHRLAPNSDGSYRLTVLHAFGSFDTDGQYPTSGVVLDAAGNVYGTTQLGGIYGYGTAWQLTQ